MAGIIFFSLPSRTLEIDNSPREPQGLEILNILVYPQEDMPRHVHDNFTYSKPSFQTSPNVHRQMTAQTYYAIFIPHNIVQQPNNEDMQQHGYWRHTCWAKRIQTQKCLWRVWNSCFNIIFKQLSNQEERKRKTGRCSIHWLTPQIAARQLWARQIYLETGTPCRCPTRVAETQVLQSFCYLPKCKQEVWP